MTEKKMTSTSLLLQGALATKYTLKARILGGGGALRRLPLNKATAEILQEKKKKK